MRCPLFGLAVFGAALVIGGCNRNDPKQDKTNPTTEPYVKVNDEKIKKDMEEFRQKAEAQLERLDSDLAQLQAKAEKAGAEARKDMEENLVDLRRRRDVAAERVREMKSATAERWNEIRPRVTSALDDVAEGFKKAVSRFK